MQTLLALAKDEVRDVLSFAVESKTGFRPLEAGSAREAIEVLAAHADIQIVICEYPGISDVLFRHIISLNRTREEPDQIRVVVCCASKPKDDALIQQMNILGYASWMNLIDSTLKLISPNKSKESPATEVAWSDRELNDNYTCRIKTTLLIRVGVMSAGVYIRLSPTKYIKLFQEGDEFSEEDYTRILREKKIDHLYLRRDEISEFLIKFKNDLIKLLAAEILTDDVYPELLEEVHEAAQELLGKLGATREVQDVVKTSVQLTLKAIGKNPQLSEIIHRLQIDREKYIASHSVLLPQIACSLALNMEWKSESTFQKLALAAFLHDVSLEDHALAAIKDLRELELFKDKFTEDEIKAYKAHPIKAAELVKQFQEVPPDVDAIILEHHERPDGSGFPRQRNHQHISPLGAVFIVAHDLVDAIFDPYSAFELEKFIASKKSEYHAGNFKKLHSHLSSLSL